MFPANNLSVPQWIRQVQGHYKGWAKLLKPRVWDCLGTVFPSADGGTFDSVAASKAFFFSLEDEATALVPEERKQIVHGLQMEAIGRITIEVS